MKFVIFALITTLATGVLAHSRLDKTTLTDGETITDIPDESSFDFAKEIRMTRVEVGLFQVALD